jgi:Fe-S cluster assembly iron-binding protein IscA
MHITPEAREKIVAFMEGSDENKLRVAKLTLGGCCGAKIQLGVSLAEEAEAGEEVLNVDGLEVLIDPLLHKQLGEVVIDCSEAGIVVRFGNREA